MNKLSLKFVLIGVMIYVSGENMVSLPADSENVNIDLQSESVLSNIPIVSTKKVKNLTELTTESSSENINEWRINLTESTNITKDNVPVIINTKLSTQLFYKPGTSTVTTPLNTNLLPLPPGANAVLVKPTKYHYYPHNQHIYLLPECAIQQVCNAVYIRLNWTQPLCACPPRYRDPCSASLNSDDFHTTKLITGTTLEKALTLVKTCEPTADMRLCRLPRDWSLLALQNIRTGKSHYLVICHCPESSILEGPISHDQPLYASVPGVRVYGMMCVQRKQRLEKAFNANIPIPWKKVVNLFTVANWD